jgi:hypothetical protein
MKCNKKATLGNIIRCYVVEMASKQGLKSKGTTEELKCHKKATKLGNIIAIFCFGNGLTHEYSESLKN